MIAAVDHPMVYATLVSQHLASTVVCGIEQTCYACLLRMLDKLDGAEVHRNSAIKAVPRQPMVQMLQV